MGRQLLPPDEELARRIGTAIRDRRKELGVTMEWLAEQSGLSQPFLSRVERGIARLSMRSLHQVAQALGLSALGLFGGMSERGTYAVLPVAERLPLKIADGGTATATALTSNISQLRAVEFSGTTTDSDDVYAHRNDAFIIVLEGRYEFVVDNERFQLSPGDAISAAGGVKHSYRIVEEPARMLVVIVSEDAHVVHDPIPVSRQP